MTSLAFVFAGALAVGLLAFCAWCVWTWATKDLQPDAGWTSWLIFNLGQGLIWLAALLIAGGVLGGAAAAAWRAIQGAA